MTRDTPTQDRTHRQPPETAERNATGNPDAGPLAQSATTGSDHARADLDDVSASTHSQSEYGLDPAADRHVARFLEAVHETRRGAGDADGTP